MSEGTRRSLVARALGAQFDELHPAVRERHGFSSEDRLYSIGEGVMDRVWHSSPLFLPFLWIGARRNIMFAEQGRDVPFRIECWSYRDSHGRETLSLNRFFEFPGKTRRFDEYVAKAPGANSLIIYVGSHQHLAAELQVLPGERGGIEFRTGRQRLLSKSLAFGFPRVLSASARVEEWYDEATERFHIEARVQNRMFGDVLGCRGSFSSRVEPVPVSGVPAEIRPVKEDPRC